MTEQIKKTVHNSGREIKQLINYIAFFNIIKVKGRIVLHAKTGNIPQKKGTRTK